MCHFHLWRHWRCMPVTLAPDLLNRKCLERLHFKSIHKANDLLNNVAQHQPLPPSRHHMQEHTPRPFLVLFIVSDILIYQGLTQRHASLQLNRICFVDGTFPLGSWRVDMGEILSYDWTIGRPSWETIEDRLLENFVIFSPKFKITSEQLLNGFEHYLKTQKWMKDLLLPLRLPLIHAQTHMPRYTPAWVKQVGQEVFAK